jgi:predicted Zn-dependent protease
LETKKHKLPKDRCLYIIFVTMAGYQPEEAINVWIRMSEIASSGQAPPEFLSTHPSNQTRIMNLKKYLPQVVAHAKNFNIIAAQKQQQAVNQ